MHIRELSVLSGYSKILKNYGISITNNGQNIIMVLSQFEEECHTILQKGEKLVSNADFSIQKIQRNLDNLPPEEQDYVRCKLDIARQRYQTIKSNYSQMQELYLSICSIVSEVKELTSEFVKSTQTHTEKGHDSLIKQVDAVLGYINSKNAIIK